MRLALAIGCLAPAVLAAVAPTQGTFRILGPGMATGVSTDGTVVSGSGWRWTAATGRVSIGGRIALGRSLSSSGTTVYGEINNEAAIWTEPTGWQILPGLMGSTGCGGSLTSPYGINDDGTVATGLAWLGCAARAYRWTAATGTVALGVLGPNSARGNAVSGDGQVVGGWDEHSTGSRRAAVWYPGGQEVLLLEGSPGNPIGSGEVWGMNSDGTVIVGNGAQTAFRWTAASGLDDLGPVPRANSGGYGLSCTEDGSMVVGYTGSAFSVLTAFIWTEIDGMMRLDDYLAKQGITVPGSAVLGVASQITPDGTAIASWGGTTPFSNEGHLIQMFTGVKYGFEPTKQHTMDLAGSGSSSIGRTFVAATSQAASAMTITLLTTRPANIPLLGGVLLVDPAPPVLVLPAVASGGSSSLSLPIPNNANLVSTSIYLQSLEAAGGSLRFSNGLRLTIRG